MPLQKRELSDCSTSSSACTCSTPSITQAPQQAVTAPTKRGFLQDLIAMAASFGVAGSARAALPGDPSFQPLRRPGMEGKRFGMLVDMRKCMAARPAQ
jgi:tetrathionate reductase subunit B